MDQIVKWIGSSESKESIANEYTHSLWDSIDKNKEMFGKNSIEAPEKEFPTRVSYLKKSGLWEELYHAA